MFTNPGKQKTSNKNIQYFRFLKDPTSQYSTFTSIGNSDLSKWNHGRAEQMFRNSGKQKIDHSIVHF